MAGEGSFTPQFSDEAMRLAYSSNFLFDEMRRAQAALKTAKETSNMPKSWDDYATADNDLNLSSKALKYLSLWQVF